MTGEFPAQRDSNAENDSIWWRHHDMRDAMLPALLVLCEGDPAVSSEFLHKLSMMRSFDIFFVVSLNKMMNKQ